MADTIFPIVLVTGVRTLLNQRVPATPEEADRVERYLRALDTLEWYEAHAEPLLVPIADPPGGVDGRE